jgi:hypothetical protein
MTLVMTGRQEAQSPALGFSAFTPAASGTFDVAKLSANGVSLVLPTHSEVAFRRMPKHYPSSADTDAMVDRVAPAILELLADGVPRSKRAIAAKLADRHPKDEVARTLMRLTVTDRLAETGGKYVVTR